MDANSANAIFSAIITGSAGVLGVIVGTIGTIVGIHLTTKSNKEIAKETIKQQKASILRAKQFDLYFKLAEIALKVSLILSRNPITSTDIDNINTVYSEEFGVFMDNSVNEFMLYSSETVIDSFNNFLHSFNSFNHTNPQTPENIKNLSNNSSILFYSLKKEIGTI